MSRRTVLATLFVLALAVPGQAEAARFDQPPPGEVTAGTPVTFTISPSGFSAASGVAFKLSNEPSWHRCLAPGRYAVTPPAGSYVVQIADDTNRPWFDAHAPNETTPECNETTAPRNEPVVWAFFTVKSPPPPPAPVDTCGPALTHVDTLQNRAETLLIRYERRRTKARRRAWKQAHDAYTRAWRAYRKRC